MQGSQVFVSLDSRLERHKDDEVSVWCRRRRERHVSISGLQGYLAHKKQPPPPQGPRHNPTIGSQGGNLSYD